MGKLLVMGDSNSGGLVNALVGVGFPIGLVQAGCTVVNETHGGESSAEGLARMAPVIAQGPFSAAIICYGTVDVMVQILAGGDAAGASAMAVFNMQQIESQLKLNGTPKVFLAEPVGCSLVTEAPDWTLEKMTLLRRRMFEIGHCLRGFAHQLSYSQLQGSDVWLPDGIHMQPRAYEALAHRVMAFLRAQGVNA